MKSLHIAMLGFAWGFAITAFFNRIAAKEFEAEAVKRGAAEWVVNPANGETTFKWKGVEP